MIDTQLFRIRIGSFDKSRKGNGGEGGEGGKGSGKIKSNGIYSDFSCDIQYPMKFYNLETDAGTGDVNVIPSSSKNIKFGLSSFLYLYFIIILSCCMLS